jgi:glycosyltransferase involved in cell wall biosynthesis
VSEAKSQNYRILLVCNDGDYFVRHRLFVVSRLCAMGVDVTALVGGSPICADSIHGWTYIHVNIERFGLSLVSDLKLMIRTAKAIWDVRPDAIHLITLKPTVFSGIVAVAARLLSGSPKRILITLPGLGRMLSGPKKPGERRYLLGAPLTLLTLRLLAKNRGVHFTFETRRDYEFWAKREIVNGNNATVIDGAGVNAALFYPADVNLGECSKIPRMKVLFASRLLKSKGLYAYLIAAREFASRSDVEFLVAGMSDEKDPDAVPSGYLKRLDEINFLDNVSEMPALLRECDVVCLPTRYGEGIPRILIEAAASGVASIASNHPGCLEIVEHNVTGQILSGETDEVLGQQLSLAIVRYLETPDILERHKRAARQKFLSRAFSQDAVAARFCELLGAPSSASETSNNEPVSNLVFDNRG